MNSRFLAVLCLFLMVACRAGGSEPVYVVVLGGQSNMAGAGNFDALSEADRARVAAVAPRVGLSVGGKDPAPLSPRFSKGQMRKRGYGNVFGPEIFIGVTLAEAHPDREFLLVKVAQGGTYLYGAWHPAWSAARAQEVEKGEQKQGMQLFAKHTEAIRENLGRVGAAGREHVFLGAAWMQGENDAALEVSARSYADNLTQLIEAYRGVCGRPEMPFVCGQINSNYGDFPEGPEMVRAAFVTVAEADPQVEVIRTMAERPPTDFPKVDGAHYDHEGQKRLGTAMGAALLDLNEIENR